MASPDKPKERPSRIRAWLKRWWPSLLTMSVITLIGILGWFYWDAILSWAQGADGESPGETLRNMALALVGAAAFAIGLPLAVWRSLGALEQAKIANEQAQIANEQVKTAVRNLNNERYHRGAEMLGSAALATRIGGVFALERLAQEYPDEYHIQIIRLLSSFIRPLKGQDSSKPSDKESKGPCPDDVEAAAQVIGRRSIEQIAIEQAERFQLDLRNCSLIDVDLYEADLSSAMLYEADFSHSFLADADFTNATLVGACLAGTYMVTADLSGANLSDADLSGANLSDADCTEVQGLTQSQLDNATIGEGGNPPKLDGTIDDETKKPLIWRGKSIPRPPRVGVTDGGGEDR